MRERFLAGEDITGGVRPEVLLSWYRCRDDYAVDPFQERAPSAPEREPSQVLEEKVVLSELAGVAKSIEPEVEALGALVAITDGRGGIVAAWGDRTTLRRADDANLTARCAWSERGAGTNGMGTALVSEGPIIIRGPEHWCAGFHDWDCAGVAVRDPVGRAPLGALDVSSPKAPLPNSVLNWLRRAQHTIESGLRDHAVRTLRDLAAVYWEEERAARGPLAATDTGGRLLLANADARQYLGIVRPERPRDLAAEVPQLHAALRQAVERAHIDGQWVGVARLTLPGRGKTPISFRPAVKDHRLVGMLLGVPDEETDAETLMTGDDIGSPAQPGRLVGLQGDRMVLVSAEQIRYAEADGSYVWLDTDRGRLRVPERGMASLEQRLATHGFLRVHRHYLVNPRRVKELAPGPNGSIWLVLDVPSGPPVPVARRRVAEVRRLLAFP
ncbi:MAG TPA: LytTR family transcriptional regulator DNA-binding domain-containing protein [Acidimicrobiia bacterium]|nr:LytTR family transcriptional regulator DNA-binding domain-containing protein [Acidimicrobiia bacterium]